MEASGSAYRVLLVGETIRQAEAGLFDGGLLAAAGPVSSYLQALEAVQRLHPDVVVVDLSAREALHAVEQIMAERPVPILALHPGVLPGAEAFKAVALGALDVLDRPPRPGVDFWQAVGRKLLLLAEVQVVRSARDRMRVRTRPPTEQAPFPLLALAASLGGPKALAVVLRSLPPGFPAPVCICQHIGQGFTEGLAQWLTAECSLRVVQGMEGEQMVPGQAYIAPSGSHLRVMPGGRLKLDDGPPVRGFKPSCDVLLTSAAEVFGSRTMGVILTGMGRDGARGLKEIRERGGRTIAQSEATCAVYGMPREAVRIGAAEEVLPLEQIGPTLARWVQAC